MTTSKVELLLAWHAISAQAWRWFWLCAVSGL